MADAEHAENAELKSFIREELSKQYELLLGLSCDMRLHLASMNPLYPAPVSEEAPSLHPKPDGARPIVKIMDEDQEEYSAEVHSRHSKRTSQNGQTHGHSPGRSTHHGQTHGHSPGRSTHHGQTHGHHGGWDHGVQLQFAEHRRSAQAKFTVDSPRFDSPRFSDKGGSNNSMVPSHWAIEKLKRIVASDYFTYCILLLISLNLVLLGVEVNVAKDLPYGQTPVGFAEINYVVVTIFTFEVLAKIGLFGCRHFFLGREMYWNIFDFIVVVISILEILIEFFVDVIATDMDTSNLRVMRFVRVARTLRGVRVIKLLRYIGSLRTIVFSIVSTLGSLFWTLVLLVMLFYCFSVIITQSVADHCRLKQLLNEPACAAELSVHWQSVEQSMLTLFLSISGGLSWGEALQPLLVVGVTSSVSYILYIVMTVFAVLNVVTGVFCNTAIESAGADREIAIMKQMKKQDTQMETLREIFEEIDIDCSEQISMSELKEALRAQKLRTFMASLGISTEDVWTLFMTVDTDGSGEISLDEFVHGCMQLQGPAKGLQVARMSYENTVMRAEIKKIQHDVMQFQSAVGDLVRVSQMRGRSPTMSHTS